jgi:hypothetical protein
VAGGADEAAAASAARRVLLTLTAALAAALAASAIETAVVDVGFLGGLLAARVANPPLPLISTFTQENHNR